MHPEKICTECVAPGRIWTVNEILMESFI